jgi:cell wall-associated NlpC family hydrolase
MRRTLHALAGLAVAALAAAAATPAARPPPALKAKRAQAQTVLAQVNALDVRFGRVVDRWDGAQIELATARRQLAVNRVALTRATRESREADRELAARLVAIYESGEPTVMDVVVGATSISSLIDRLHAASTIASYDRRVADRARHARARLVTARQRLQAAERTRRATVETLTAERGRIAALLDRRRRLLASIQSEIATIKAREAAKQKALAAAARARLAREQALIAKRAAAQAAAQQAAAAAVAAAATEPATTLAAPPLPTPTDPVTGTQTAPATPAFPLGAGHPDAAIIALRYLGIPYKWGSASPATGFDCSGLVMYVYAQLGIALPHQAAAQYRYGVAVPRDQLQPGDLVFYDGLSHVAIYIGNGEVVHAPQTGDVVKISPVLQAGPHYVGARRI